ncbi:MAG: T9SS type A sorting domain-containing protein [Bacteroidota bacterium]
MLYSERVLASTVLIGATSRTAIEKRTGWEIGLWGFGDERPSGAPGLIPAAAALRGWYRCTGFGADGKPDFAEDPARPTLADRPDLAYTQGQPVAHGILREVGALSSRANAITLTVKAASGAVKATYTWSGERNGRGEYVLRTAQSAPHPVRTARACPATRAVWIDPVPEGDTPYAPGDGVWADYWVTPPPDEKEIIDATPELQRILIDEEKSVVLGEGTYYAMTRFRTWAALIALLTLAAPEARAQTPLGVFAQLDNVADDILVLSDGRVLVGEQGSFDIFAFEANGTSLGQFTPFGRIPLVELGADRILVGGGRTVITVDGTGTRVDTFATGLNFPEDAVQLTDGRVLFAEFGDTGNGRVSQYDPDGTRRPAFANDVFTPNSVAQLADGRVLVIEFFGRQVSAFAPDRTRLDPFITNIAAGFDILQLPDGRVLIAGLNGAGIGAGLSSFSPEGDYLGDFVDRDGIALALTLDGRVLLASGDAVYAYAVMPVSSEPEAPEASGVGAVYPQPLARGAQASVEVSAEAPGVVTIQVFDALGRLVAEARPLAVAGRQRQSVPVSGLGAGVYVVRVEGAGLAASRRVTIL